MNKRIFFNNRIRAREVRVIDETGKQLGIMELRDALRLSRERGLDLIQVTEKVDPPVCKLGNYGKYLYQIEKKQREIKKQKKGNIKGIRLSFNISPHDMETRAHLAEKFLKRGDKIRIEMRLKGREKALQETAKKKINDFVKILEGIIPLNIESELKKQPRGLTMIIGNKTKTKVGPKNKN